MVEIFLFIIALACLPTAIVVALNITHGAWMGAQAGARGIKSGAINLLRALPHIIFGALVIGLTHWLTTYAPAEIPLLPAFFGAIMFVGLIYALTVKAYRRATRERTP